MYSLHLTQDFANMLKLFSSGPRRSQAFPGVPRPRFHPPSSPACFVQDGSAALAIVGKLSNRCLETSHCEEPNENAKIRWSFHGEFM